MKIPNSRFLVRWEMHIFDAARTPREAAVEALRIQRDPASIATNFQVYPHRKRKPIYIDLSPDDLSFQPYRQENIMSTRSRIGIKNLNKSITSVYCHSDGYLEYNGVILSEFYKNEEKIRALIALGDLSSLGEEIAPPPGVEHSFDKRADKITVAYTRDRGDEDVKPETSKTEATYLKLTDQCNGEFAYLWKDGAWFVSTNPNKKVPFKEIPVAELLERINS